MESQNSQLAPVFQEFTAPEVPLKVLLDARKLGDGGIGIYIQNLIAGLLCSHEVDLTLLVSSDKKSFVPSAKLLNLIEDNSKSYSFDEMFHLSKRIDFSRFDLFHVPHYTLPYNVPIPTVVTVHDLIHITNPEKFYYPFVAGFLIRSALKRATKVLTVSKASKESLCNFSKGIAGKVKVVPNAVDPFMISSEGISQSFSEKYLIKNREYILGVFSNSKPHKGLSDLVRAFNQVKENLKETKLVLVGHGIPSVEDFSKRFKDVSDFEDIVFVGSVNRVELSQLYAGATCLAISSYMEGFSLPVIEAKSQGTPVVTRPVKAIMELINDDDIICKDFSIESLANGLVEGYLSFKERTATSLTKMDLSPYTVERTGMATTDLYREAISAFKSQTS